MSGATVNDQFGTYGCAIVQLNFGNQVGALVFENDWDGFVSFSPGEPLTVELVGLIKSEAGSHVIDLYCKTIKEIVADNPENRNTHVSRQVETVLVNNGTGHIGGGCSADLRSEEHTSELKSLMRLSYAVFCLNKKNYK